MKCPFCNHTNTRVTDSRDTDDGASIRRRRECLSCGKRFTTYETVERSLLRVIKKDGTRELYDRNKVRGGIVRACEKRNITSEQIEEMVNAVEHRVRNDAHQEVSTEDIGNFVMDELKKVDQVAYVRFASVYREFKDIGSFMDELKHLMKNNSEASKQEKNSEEGK
jgi:transcriptional repressor NrdR